MLELDQKIYALNTTRPKKKLKSKFKELSSVIKALELNYTKSQKNDRMLLMALRMETIQNESLGSQLQEALKENRQIMDLIQLRNDDFSMNSGCSKANLGSSISTMSLVHLQYKYEELLASHGGLLKILELRNNEVKKHVEEARSLQDKIQRLTFDLGIAQDKIEFLQQKIRDVKRKKREKVAKLKAERQTLALVHRRLVALLHRQCMEKNDFVESLLKTTTRSEKALLLQEVKKNNILTYNNFHLQQEIEYLRSLLKVSRTFSKETDVSSAVGSRSSA